MFLRLTRDSDPVNDSRVRVETHLLCCCLVLKPRAFKLEGSLYHLFLYPSRAPADFKLEIFPSTMESNVVLT